MEQKNCAALDLQAMRQSMQDVILAHHHRIERLNFVGDSMKNHVPLLGLCLMS